MAYLSLVMVARYMYSQLLQFGKKVNVSYALLTALDYIPKEQSTLRSSHICMGGAQDIHTLCVPYTYMYVY